MLWRASTRPLAHQLRPAGALLAAARDCPVRTGGATVPPAACFEPSRRPPVSPTVFSAPPAHSLAARPAGRWLAPAGKPS